MSITTSSLFLSGHIIIYTDTILYLIKGAKKQNKKKEKNVNDNRQTCVDCNWADSSN